MLLYGGGALLVIAWGLFFRAVYMETTPASRTRQGQDELRETPMGRKVLELDG